MAALTNLYPQNPAGIFLVAGIFFVAYLALRNSAGVRATALLIPATAWTIGALWEVIIMFFSPEANIRVDLLIIVPVLLILSLYGIVRAFFARGS